MTAVTLNRRRISSATHAALALVAFVPLLLTAPDRIAADTRQYFYTDPDTFLTRALTLWDPHVHLGTVTHSNIGNVFPMGTFFAAANAIGLPVWSAQRIWIGLILFAAGAGVLFLARSMRWNGVGVVVAAFAYMLTPYALQYAPRTSVLLLPFAALPWLIGLTERALRTGGWRHPAVLALVIMTVSGANVSPTILLLLGPAIWIACSVVRHDSTWRDARAVIGRTALLGLGTCALWLTALVVEGHYGLDLLAYTETLSQVSTTSTAPEALRGLGYWLFYGTEARIPNIAGATWYLEHTGFVLVSYLVPGLALLAAFTVRWKHRAFSIALVLTGVIIAVGAYPFANPSALGRGYKGLADLSSAALALRSSTRAVPLVVLGLALLLAAGVDALWARRVRVGQVALAAVLVLVLANAIALFSGDFVDRAFSRPEAIPQYWRDAARALDRKGSATRVLEIPGNQFAAYRWGNTYDTSVLAAILDRPSVAREQIPFGSASAADLVAALDRRIQEGVLEPEALGPIARLLSAGDVLLRSDLEYERYAAARPRSLWAQLVPAPAGLGAPTGYGTPRANTPDPRSPLLDAQTLGLAASSPDPPPVAVFPVPGTPDIVHAVTAARPTILDGDGEGLVDAAGVGLVPTDRLVQYAAWFASHPKQLHAAVAAGADVVITDTNRRRERRWRSTHFNTGLTDRAGHTQPDTGQGESELDVFPGTSDATRSVAIQRGATVDASVYGSPVTFDTDERAANALDGDPSTAWEVGTITDPVGQSITIRPEHPLRIDHLDLLQAQGGNRTRTVHDVELRFDGGAPIRVGLDATSLAGAGQRITFPPTTFSKLTLTITGTQESPDIVSLGGSPTGFAEITIPGLNFEELIRVPVDLTKALRDDPGHSLAYVLTRLRSNPAERGDEETSLARVLGVPSTRDFSLTGTARLSATAPDDVLDRLVGASGADTGGVTITSSDRLPGAIDQRGRAALDGDPSTHWTSTFFDQVGSWIQAAFPTPRTLDHLDLAVVADGRHSVPTQIRVDAGGVQRIVDIPPVVDVAVPDGVVNVPVRFAPVTGTDVRVTVTAVRPVTSIDAFSGRALPQPVAIAELGIPGAVAPAQAATVDATCRSDLLTVDGTPVPVRVVGTSANANARRALDLVACGAPLTLDSGRHEIRSALGRRTGIDVDRVVLASARDGSARPLANGTAVVAGPAPRAPRVRVVDDGATSKTIRVAPSDHGSWLVLGESINDGWKASVDGGASLGPPSLVQGYANGWYLPPSSTARTIDVTWAPQGTIRLASIVTLLAILLCLVLVWRGRRWLSSTDASPATLTWIGAEPNAAVKLTAAPMLIVAAAAVGGWLVVGPLTGAGAAALAFAALRWRFGRVVLATAALGLVAAGLLGVVGTQAREDRPIGYGWVSGEETEHRLALSGLVLLGLDPVIAAQRAKARAGKDPPEADG